MEIDKLSVQRFRGGVSVMEYKGFTRGGEGSVRGLLVIIFSNGVSQEIYRPGTAISNASNLCTAVGGDQNKEYRGKTSIMRGGE